MYSDHHLKESRKPKSLIIQALKIASMLTLTFVLIFIFSYTPKLYKLKLNLLDTDFQKKLWDVDKDNYLPLNCKIPNEELKRELESSFVSLLKDEVESETDIQRYVSTLETKAGAKCSSADPSTHTFSCKITFIQIQATQVLSWNGWKVDFAILYEDSIEYILTQANQIAIKVSLPCGKKTKLVEQSKLDEVNQMLKGNNDGLHSWGAWL